MLESGRNRTDIHDLVLDTPREQSFAWWQKYEDLARLPHVQEWRQRVDFTFWPRYLDAGLNEEAVITAGTEILDALLHEEAEPGTGAAVLDRLSWTMLFQDGVWHELTVPGNRTPAVRLARDELSALLLLRDTAPGEVRRKLEELMMGDLYDPRSGLWRASMTTHTFIPRTAPNDDFRTGDQCLAAYVTGDRERAARILRMLRHEASDGDGWLLLSVPHDTDRRRVLTDCATRYLCSQLWAVVLETLVDPAAAHASWERLRLSPFYDAEHGRWRVTLVETQGEEDTFYDQLLALYAQAKVEKLPSSDHAAAEAIPSLLNIN